MENTFLTDAQLPATVADLTTIQKDYLFRRGVKTANNRLIVSQNDPVEGSVYFMHELNNGKRSMYSLDNVGNLCFYIHDGSTSWLQALVISQTGVVSKIGGGSFSAISDERMKTNITPFEDGLNKVLSINPKTFQYKAVEGTPTENYPDFICGKTQYGVIAQELETIAPEMVTTGEDGFKSVDLSNLCLLLVNAVKEQNQMILDLTARIEVLETPTPQA